MFKRKQGRPRHLELSSAKVQRHLVLISLIWIQSGSVTTATPASIVILVANLHSLAKVVGFFSWTRLVNVRWILEIENASYKNWTRSLPSHQHQYHFAWRGWLTQTWKHERDFQLIAQNVFYHSRKNSCYILTVWIITRHVEWMSGSIAR